MIRTEVGSICKVVISLKVKWLVLPCSYIVFPQSMVMIRIWPRGNESLGLFIPDPTQLRFSGRRHADSWSCTEPKSGPRRDGKTARQHKDHRRKFRSQTSDNMDRWKAEMGRVREKRREEERRSKKRKSQKKEDAGARKGWKVAKHCVFSNDLWLRRVEK